MVQATSVRNLRSLQKQWEQGLSSFKKQRAIQQAAVRYTHLLQIIQCICMWNRSTSFHHIVQHPRESRIPDYSIRIKQTNKKQCSLLDRIGIYWTVEKGSGGRKIWAKYLEVGHLGLKAFQNSSFSGLLRNTQRYPEHDQQWGTTYIILFCICGTNLSVFKGKFWLVIFVWPTFTLPMCMHYPKYQKLSGKCKECMSRLQSTPV